VSLVVDRHSSPERAHRAVGLGGDHVLSALDAPATRAMRRRSKGESISHRMSVSAAGRAAITTRNNFPSARTARGSLVERAG
jgi:hypothetical protein